RAALEHGRAEQPAELEDRAQVDLDDAVPRLERELGGRVPLLHARVVDQDVDPVVGEHRLRGRGDRGTVGEVERAGRQVPAQRGGGVGEVGGQRRAAERHDVGARLEERERDPAAEAAAPAGDDRRLPAEVERVGSPITRHAPSMARGQTVPDRDRRRGMRMRHDAVLAETIGIRGADDDEIEAYTARPMDGGHRGGVVVIHHMPGYDWATKEIVRRFAVWGYNAICMNLYSREAPGADPDDAAATARARGGVPDARFVGDAAGAARWLRSLPTSNGKVGTIGFCSGGRQAFLSAVELDIQAAVDCYGAFVVGSPPEGF